jgi:solute carrier family 25 folate transporter 32
MISLEGPGGLYRGLPPTLIGILPSHAIYFGVYEHLKSTISSLRHTDPRRDPLTHVLSAMGAAACSNLITNPLWLVRTRLMIDYNYFNRPFISQTRYPLFEPKSHLESLPKGVSMGSSSVKKILEGSRTKLKSNRQREMFFRSRSNYYSGTIDAFKRIWFEEGFRAFYKGASASMLGTLHVCVYFPIYEHLKIRLSPKAEGHSLSVAAASAISKLVATSLTYPHEVIRTRLQTYQTQKHSLISTIKSIWISEGLSGFYRGLVINIVRAVPSAAASFVVYEKSVRLLSNL